MKKQTKTRLLALLLLLAMVLGLIPAALATDTESPGSVPESSLETQESTGGTEPDTSQTPEPSPTVSPEPDTAVDVSPSPSPSPEPSVSPTPSSTPETNTGPVIETGGTSQGTDNDTPDAEDADEIPPGGKTVALPAYMLTPFATRSSSATMSGGTMLYTYGGGSRSLTFSYTDALGEYHHSSYIWLQPYYLNGNSAFCIEPDIHVADGMTYTQDEANKAWTQRLTENQRQAIALALAYGYPNTWYDKSPRDSTTSEYVEAQKLLATQAVIWEIVTGQRSATAPYAAVTSLSFDYAYPSSWWPTLTYVRDQIVAAMAAHQDIPSFASYSSSTAPTYKLTYDAGSGTYKTALTDTNGVLSSYNFSTSLSGVTFTKSGNTLYVEATPAAVAQATSCTASAAGTSLAVDPSIALVWAPSVAGYQAQVQLAAKPTTATAYIKLNWVSAGSATLIKTSTNPEMVKNNSCYSLVGTTYGLYSDSACKNKVGTFVVNANGTSNTIENLPAGTYYYKELTAGKGYQLDTTVRSVQVTAGKTATIYAEDVPIGDPLTITLEKSNKDASGNTSATPLSLAGAKFSITYYSGMYTTESAAEADAKAGKIQKRTWYITTKAYTVGSVTKYLASIALEKPEGDDLFYGENTGQPIVPMGTVIVKEVQAPTGYINSADFYFTSDPNTSYGSSIIVQFDGSNKPKNVATGNYMDDFSLSVYEAQVKGGVKVRKADAGTGTTPQGDAALSGAKFGIYNDNNYAVYIDGKEYKQGALVTTITTDKNGNAATASDALPYGKYYLQEITPPTGYTPSSQKVSFTISSSGTVVDLGNYSDTVIQGKIQVEKWAVNTVTGDKQPEKGATFEVWLKSAGSYEKAKDSEKDVITIGEDGTGTSKNLPYGTYLLKQKTGWEGYDPDETTYEVTITSNGTVVDQDTDGKDLEVENNIWTGSISILKVDGDTRQPLAGAEFTLTGSDGSEVVKVSDDSGTVTFEDLYYGVEYTWTETKPPKGYLLNEENTGTWTVDKQDDLLEVTCEDFRRPGSITVTKEDTNGQPLAGCTFLLEYLDGTTWKPVTNRASDTPVTLGATTSPVVDGCLTTDASGVVTFSGLWADDTLQYRLTEVDAPDGYTLLTEPIFEGVLPVSYPDGEVSAEPEEVIEGIAYFYDLPVTVRDGKVYTLPLTGGNGYAYAPIGWIALILGAFLCGIAIIKKRKGEKQS